MLPDLSQRSGQDLRFAQIVADMVVIVESGTVKCSSTFADLDQHPETRDAYLAV